MSNDLQTNLGYFMITNYGNFLLCYLSDIFFAMHAGAKEFNDVDFQVMQQIKLRMVEKVSTEHKNIFLQIL